MITVHICAKQEVQRAGYLPKPPLPDSSGFPNGCQSRTTAEAAPQRSSGLSGGNTRRRSLLQSQHSRFLMMSGVQHSAPKPFWMRSLSFAGLHRLLHVIHDAPGGLRATEVNHRVLSGELTLSRSNAKPKPTTLYHYRNTLFRLGTIGHDGKHLIPKLDNPHVEGLLETQPPANDVFELSAVARRHFAALVLQNQQCRELFFDLFMLPGNEYASLADFSEKGTPVSWTLTKPSAEEPPHSPTVPLKQRRRSRKEPATPSSDSRRFSSGLLTQEWSRGPRKFFGLPKNFFRLPGRQFACRLQLMSSLPRQYCCAGIGANCSVWFTRFETEVV